MMISNKKLTNQSGLVAIIVTMIIIIVISLVVIGFARLTRRSQVQTLDRQLNTQALYAAEAGVNDAIQAINNNSVLASRAYTKCDGTSDDFIHASNANLGSKKVLEPNVEYTCLLVDPAPTTLTYQNVEPFEYKVVPVKAASPISSITIAWENPNKASDGELASCVIADQNDFTTRANWPARCNHPVLRVDVISENNTKNVNNLRNLGNTAVFFAYPSQGGVPAVGFNSGTGDNQGSRRPVTCLSGANKCTLNIDVAAFGQNSYYLRLTPIYYSATIDVSAGGQALLGAQAVVDSTGKAQDILKRVQVRVPLGGFNIAPFFAIQSGSHLCKQLNVNAGDANTADPVNCPFN